MADKTKGGLLALMAPSSVGGSGIGKGGLNSTSDPASALGGDDLTMAAEDFLKALKERDPSRVAESLQSFVSLC